MEEHIEYPSLLVVKDVLNVYGVESIAIRKGGYSYIDFQTPFVGLIQQEDWGQPGFVVVTDVNEKQVMYMDTVQQKHIQVSLSDFDRIDRGIVLLLDDEEKKDEEDYVSNRKKEKISNAIKQLPVFLVLLTVLFSGIYLFSNHPIIIALYAFGSLSTSLIGLGITIILLWHEVDAHNPFVKEVCGGQGRKMNCNAVLNSSGAVFLGVSWSIWGFGYFTAIFVGQLLFVGQQDYMTLWSVISLFPVLYIFYSFYYQWKVIKQWCPLCVGVQIVLFVQIILAVLFLIFENPVDISWYKAYSVLAMGAGVVLTTYYAVPIVKKARDSKNNERGWKQLRYNPDVFQSLLVKGDLITASPEGIGIVIGNPEAKNEIIKVCNPYCVPCSNAHPELEYIVQHNQDVKVRVIFTASGEYDDIKTAPVAHLLAIEEKYGKEKVHIALDEWYMSKLKNYEAFAAKHPMNEELKDQLPKIRAMKDWCDIMKIRVTPTIYINNREIPEGYHVSELKNFF